MTDIVIRVEGLEQLVRAFDGAGQMIETELTRATWHAVADAQRFLAHYPPPPQGSRYVRTGTLGRRWTSDVRTGGSDIRGIVHNRLTPYAPYVQDALQQAQIHRGRWQTVQDVSRPPVLDRIVGYFMAALRRVADRLGSG